MSAPDPCLIAPKRRGVRHADDLFAEDGAHRLYPAIEHALGTFDRIGGSSGSPSGRQDPTRPRIQRVLVALGALRPDHDDVVAVDALDIARRLAGKVGAQQPAEVETDRVHRVVDEERNRPPVSRHERQDRNGLVALASQIWSLVPALRLRVDRVTIDVEMALTSPVSDAGGLKLGDGATHGLDSGIVEHGRCRRPSASSGCGRCPTAATCCERSSCRTTGRRRGTAPGRGAKGRGDAKATVAVRVGRRRQHVFDWDLELGGNTLRDVGPRLLAERDLICPDERRACRAVVDDDSVRVEAIANLVALRRRRRDVDTRRADAQAACRCGLLCHGGRRAIRHKRQQKSRRAETTTDPDAVHAFAPCGPRPP